MTYYKTKVEALSQQYDQLKSQVKKDRQRFNTADESYLDAVEANDILQAVAQELQEQAHVQISTVVSRCLAAVFDEPYVFEIVFERKRNRTQANLTLSRDGLEIGNPMHAAGGGVIDVAAFALRLSALLLQKPARRRLLVLDEPFRFVSTEYRSRLPIMLELLSTEFDVQFVMITHMDELRCGSVIELEKDNAN